MKSRAACRVSRWFSIRAVSLSRPIAATLLAFASVAAAAPCAAQVAAPLLDLNGPTLTTYLPTAKTPKQNLIPRFDQRGVDLDGTLRGPSVLGWRLNADPLGGGYASGRMLGDVNLFTGAYAPTDVDMALPTLGLPVVIGRSYNPVANDGSRYDTNGYQGWNWSALEHPELIFKAGETAADDVVYIVYGADRYIEFGRADVEDGSYFKAKNGAAGVVSKFFAYSTEPDIYTYTDQRGNTMDFIGFDANTGGADGQLWRMTDPAGYVTYVGHPTVASTAISNGFSSGKITKMYDASGREYAFTYSTVASTYTRLTQVQARTKTGGTWHNPVSPSGTSTVGTVNYSYYDGTGADSAEGSNGDLKLVTITLPGTGANDYITKKYYRYYTLSWANSAGRLGSPHAIRLAVMPEGVRRADFGVGSNYNGDFDTMTNADLDDYAEEYLEYDADNRLSKAVLNGACGCAGGSGVTYLFTYADAGSYATYTTGANKASYDAVWARRTVVHNPDDTYSTHYFDEVGQCIMRVLTNREPGDSPTKIWANAVTRDTTSGQEGVVLQIHSPENLTGYDHTAATITKEASTGLVTAYSHESSGNLKGMRNQTDIMEGTSGSAIRQSAVTMSERQLAVGGCGVSIPDVSAMSVYPDAVAGTPGTAQTTSITTTYWSATTSAPLYLAPMIVQRAAPAVSGGNHGPGTATSTYRYLRQDGSVGLTKDATGIYFYSNENGFGLVTTRVSDANLASSDLSADNANMGGSYWNTGTSTVTGALHAKAAMTYDAQGRTLTVVSPAVGGGTRTSAMVYTTRSDQRLDTMVSPRFASSNYEGPVSYTCTNLAGKVEISATIQVTSPGSSMPSSTVSSDWQRVVVNLYDSPGVRMTESRLFTVLASYPSSGYDSTAFTYDSMGRRLKTTDPTLTITKNVYDERGLVTSVLVGTSDPSDLISVEDRVYDGGSAGKNGYLTSTTRDPQGGASARTTTYTNDFRGRAIVTANPLAPHSVSKYDNLNRVVATAIYSSTSGLSTSTDPSATSASTRRGLSETTYDERGQVSQSKRYEIIQSGGSAGNKNDSITTDNWYDANGRSVAMRGTTITKQAYDRLGRPIGQYLLITVNDDDTTGSPSVATKYARALDVSGDEVLEESHTCVDGGTGRALFTHSVQRNHDHALTSRTGALDSNADADRATVTAANVKGRVQIRAMWYDNLDRVSDSVVYGTNAIVGDASTSTGTFTRGGSAPGSSSSSAYLTKYTFNGWGQIKDVTDPMGIAARTTYDDAGRKFKTIGDYVDGTAGGGAEDQDKVTEYTYTSGMVTSVTQRMTSGGDDQVTSYTYDTTGGSSIIKRKNLLTTTVYAEQSGGQSAGDRTMTYTYNGLSEVLTTQDPGGNTITNTYDNMGRVTLRDITALGSGFDGTVDKVETTYDSRGMREFIRQKSSGGTVLDEVRMGYDDWGNPTVMTQDPDSSIGGSGMSDLDSTRSYARNTATGGWQNMKLTGWGSPGGVSMTVGFGTGGGINDLIGRAQQLTDQSTATVASYTYLGSGTVARATLPEPNVHSGLYEGGGSADYATYLDRFNRPIVNSWTKDGTTGGGVTTPVYVDYAMAYDYVSNLTAVKDSVLGSGGSSKASTMDLLNTFDNLRRLTSTYEGALNGGMTAISTETRRDLQDRILSGRVSTQKISLDGNGTYTNGPLASVDGGEKNEARLYNKRNELIQRSVLDKDFPSTPKDYYLTHDKNGNMTSDGEKYDYVYNPWCQLVQVKVKGTATVAANFTYNGLGMRISEQLDTNRSGNTGVSDGVVDGNDQVFWIYVDSMGRRVATYRDGDSDPKESFEYHVNGRGPGFTGGILLRDRDSALAADPNKWAGTAASATRAERIYQCADFRGNTVALVKSDGKLMERFHYSPTGVPTGMPLGDVDADGKVDSADSTAYTGISGGSYQPRGDLDLDGFVNSADSSIITTYSGQTTGRGKFSRDSVAWRVGWRGMEWNAAIAFYSITYVAYIPSLQIHMNKCGRSAGTGQDRKDDTDLPLAACGLLDVINNPRINDVWRAIQRTCPSMNPGMIRCRKCDDGDAGGFNPGPPPILTICYPQCDVEGTLLHELQHALQACEQGFGRIPDDQFFERWNDCQSRLQNELDAYFVANYDRCPYPKCSARHRDCICGLACESAKRVCGGSPSQMLDCLLRCGPQGQTPPSVYDQYFGCR